MSTNEAAKYPFDSEFSSVVERLLEKWHVPGIAIGVIDGDRIWTKGFGFADVSSQSPVKPETLFFGCSTTKAFTGAAVAHMIDSKEYKNPSFPNQAVDWKTPISQILAADFVLQDDWATTHITLEDALTHRSGMPRHDWAYGGTDATVKDVVRSMRHLPLNETPRNKWQYCNLMYITASHALETLTSRGLGEILHDWIWKPLGMKSTFWSIEDARKANAEVAVGYYWDPQLKVFKEMAYMGMKEVSGAGAILSNVMDYSKWVRALINEDKFLSKNVHESIKRPRIFQSGSKGNYDTPAGYSLGWLTSSYKGHQFCVHDGATDSFGADVTFFPDLKFGVVTLANAAYFGEAVGEMLTFKLIDDKLGVPAVGRVDWEKRLQQRLEQGYGLSEKAEEILYPNRPEQTLTPTLPLESYAGTYFNPGWGNMTITLLTPEISGKRPKAQLGFQRLDSTWKRTGEFEHVTGEYWIMYSTFATLPVAPFEISPVEFKISIDGKVSGLELEFGNSPKGKGEGLVQFKKVA